MRKTVMQWRLVLDWDGDTEEAAVHKAKRLLDEVIFPAENRVLEIIGRQAILGGLEGRALCVTCGAMGTAPDNIEHETECVP